MRLECKTTTHRVKGRGRRWDSANAEAMMALAALHDSNLWNQFDIGDGCATVSI